MSTLPPPNAMICVLPILLLCPSLIVCILHLVITTCTVHNDADVLSNVLWYNLAPYRANLSAMTAGNKQQRKLACHESRTTISAASG